jgi:HlyD family secretion protein
MKRRRGPSLLWLLGAVALAAAMAYAFWPRAVEVDVGRVDRGPMRTTVDEDGKTRVRDRYVVSAPISGRLRRVTLRAGDPIRVGKTVLAVIEPDAPAPLDARERAQAEARLKAADASLSKAASELDRAKTAHDYAQQDLERMREGFARKVISHQALDAAEEKELTTSQEVIAATFARQVAQFEVEQARAVLDRRASPTATAPADWLLDVPAPVDGAVLRVFQESAAVVTAGTKLVEVGDPRNLEVEVDVLSRDGAAIPTGAKVMLDGWGGPHPLAGRVRLVEPSAFTKVSALGVEEQRVNVIIDLVDPPDQRPTLGDAFRVDAHITTWEAADVPKVPAGALFRHGDGWAVFVVNDGKAHLREVEVGRQNATEAKLLGGLDRNATVVLFPGDKIRDGVRVAERAR